MTISLEVRKLQAEEGFNKNAARLGVNGTFMGTQFTALGTVWTVLGLNRRVRKTPVVAVDAKQRVRWFTVDDVNSNKLSA